MLSRSPLRSSLLAALGALGALAVAGCGDDSSSRRLPDAAVQDGPASPDAAVDAPTSGIVSLTITQDGAPRAGVFVYFQEADGTLTAKVATDNTGRASTEMGTGGAVTVVNPFTGEQSGDEVRTFAGVKPGDDLRLDRDFTQPAPDTMVVEAPLDNDGVTYAFDSSCSDRRSLFADGSGGAPADILDFYGCGGAADALAVALDINGTPIKSVYAANQAITNDGTLTLTGAYTAVPQVTYSVTGAPATVGGVRLDVRQATARGEVWRDNRNLEVVSGAGTTTLARPIVTGATVTIEAGLFTSGISGQTVVDRGAPQDPTTISLASTLLAPYASTPSIDAAAQAVTWTAGAGEAPDLTVARIYAGRDGINAMFWDWQIVAPYATGALALPALPAELAEYNYLATDATDVYDLTTAKVPGGYDAVRAQALNVDLRNDAGGAVAGASGRAVVQYLVGVARHTPALGLRAALRGMVAPPARR